jgi:hypothetical protein
MLGTAAGLRRLALIALVALAGSARAEQPVAIVFVLAGQSNMVGMGNIAELDERLHRQPSNVEFYVGGMRKLMGAQESAGPEFSLAHELSRSLPDQQIILIKYAVSGTSLLAWAPDWSAERTTLTGDRFAGPMYRTLLGQVRTVTQGRPVELGAVFWMQGERDARFPAAAAQYEENFGALINSLRRDLNAPVLPFIYGQINPPTAAYLGRTAVRDAQLNAERTLPNAKLVRTDDLSKLPDQLHYDTQGQVALGRRFARAYIELSTRRNPELAARKKRSA